MADEQEEEGGKKGSLIKIIILVVAVRSHAVLCGFFRQKGC